MNDIINEKNRNFDLDNDVVNKLTDLCIFYQIEETKKTIKLIEYNIDFYKFRIEDIKNSKPFWFQKNKLKSYYDELGQLEKRLEQWYDELFKEIKSMDELKK